MTGDKQFVIEVKNREGERLFTTSYDPSKLTPTLGSVLMEVKRRIEGGSPLERHVDKPLTVEPPEGEEK